MRILILGNSGGGLLCFRRELLEELVKQQHTVYCCVPSSDSDIEIKAIGCSVVPIHLERHGTNLIEEAKLVNNYSKIIKQISPDIVFTYTIKCNAYGGMACARQKVPYVANITGLGTAIENGGLMQKMGLILYKLGLRKAQKVFFQNTENRDFMINHRVVKGAYDMLPGSGVNLERYKVTPYPNGETIDFVFIARVVKEKGIDQYLDAAKEIKKRHPETRFHICGSCEQDTYHDILNKLNDDGIIIYHGAVSNMLPIYQMDSCTIHPTYYPEGLSNVLLESASSGRPIITTDRSGCREVVDDGVNGYIVKQKDSEDLIDKIEEFLKLSWEQKRNMGLAGRVKVEQEFDRRIVVNKYLAELSRKE